MRAASTLFNQKPLSNLACEKTRPCETPKTKTTTTLSSTYLIPNTFSNTTSSAPHKVPIKNTPQELNWKITQKQLSVPRSMPLPPPHQRNERDRSPQRSAPSFKVAHEILDAWIPLKAAHLSWCRPCSKGGRDVASPSLACLRIHPVILPFVLSSSSSMPTFPQGGAG